MACVGRTSPIKSGAEMKSQGSAGDREAGQRGRWVDQILDAWLLFVSELDDITGPNITFLSLREYSADKVRELENDFFF